MRHIAKLGVRFGGVRMKKLLLIPTIAVTAFLAFAFLAPAAATGVLRTIAPALQLGHADVTGTAVGSVVNAGPGGGARASNAGALRSSTGSGGTAQGSSDALQASNNAAQEPSDQVGHTNTTPGRTNCGRFGGGFHGGKHDFTCPNKQFPDPAS